MRLNGIFALCLVATLSVSGCGDSEPGKNNKEQTAKAAATTAETSETTAEASKNRVTISGNVPHPMPEWVMQELGEGETLTLEFLGALESSLHGHDVNVYELTPEEFDAYVQRLIQKNPQHSPAFTKAVLQRLVLRYNEQKGDENKKKYFVDKLKADHRIYLTFE